MVPNHFVFFVFCVQHLCLFNLYYYLVHFANHLFFFSSSSSLCLAAAPTLPPLKSEHFKPCQEKDLAYCLNDGECFVIETLSGPHKHCR